MHNLTMVVKRRLNCDSNGFDFHNIPKAPRSSRRKVSIKRADNVHNQISAIDLLASVVGKLLEDSESSSTSTYEDNHNHLLGEIKQEHEDVFNKLCKSEFSDPPSKSPSDNTKETCLQFSSLENDCILEHTPVSDCKNGVVGCCESKKGGHDLPTESGSITEDTGVSHVDAGLEQDGGLIADPSQLHVQFPGSVCGDVKLPLGTNSVPNGSFEGYMNHSKLDCRDDDEKHCKYYKYSDKCKSNIPLTRVVNRRVKKSTMTKHGRAFFISKCFEDTRTDGYLNAFHRKRKLCYGYNPWKHETVRRKRGLSDKVLVVNSDGGLSSESVSNSPKKEESENGVLSAAIGLHSKDSRVKFSIKSLKIPELYIEVPETETVGSLKRTVMEAVTALLSDGIHIGVLVQGKKLRDNNNTLSQTGLSCRGNLGNIGFTLEPGSEKLPLPLCSENPVVTMQTDSTSFSEMSAALQDADRLIHSGNRVENNHELVLYQSKISADEQQPSSDSTMESEALAIVPVNEKPKRTELSQRRTRRPFSVTEVEALVHAVEEIGTGRWRDVKLRSFQNASHRTYVDLKDKWKTLVHTASISPQQRRGEPVPQELLDRVLGAHRYWSQHQLKHNGKHQVAAATMVV